MSHLGCHARVEGILILCRAHLLPPHHLLQAHVVVVLEVAHALPVDVSLDLRADRRGGKGMRNGRKLAAASKKENTLKSIQIQIISLKGREVGLGETKEGEIR